VDKRYVRDHVGILINRIKTKLRAEEGISGIAPPKSTEHEIMVEEIVAEATTTTTATAATLGITATDVEAATTPN